MLWTYITIASQYRLAWMSLAVGFLVAFAIRFMGKGVDLWYGIVAGALTLLACFAGSASTTISIIAIKGNTPFLTILQKLSPSDYLYMAKASAGALNALIYVIAIALAYFFAFTHVTRENLLTLSRKLK